MSTEQTSEQIQDELHGMAVRLEQVTARLKAETGKPLEAEGITALLDGLILRREAMDLARGCARMCDGCPGFHKYQVCRSAWGHLERALLAVEVAALALIFPRAMQRFGEAAVAQGRERLDEALAVLQGTDDPTKAGN